MKNKYFFNDNSRKEIVMEKSKHFEEDGETGKTMEVFLFDILRKKLFFGYKKVGHASAIYRGWESTFFLGEIKIEERYQSLGIEDGIVNVFLDIAKDLKAKKIEAGIFDIKRTQQDKLIDFYREHGFKIVTEYPGKRPEMIAKVEMML